MDLWQLCDGAGQITTLAGDFVRMVESQQHVATTRIVDNLEEQGILESLLEGTKPPLATDTGHLHYLLATPFRYPPLLHGSRFGQRHERSLLYASSSLPTLLAEAGYYRFVFWNGMRTPPPSAQLITEHTVFGERYHTGRGVRLQQGPFARYQDALRNPADYAITQRLGSAMRAAGVEALEYVSAREPARGINVGLYTAAALSVPAPLFSEQWLCSTSQEVVRFSSREVTQVFSFSLYDFQVDGVLPSPAC